MTKIKRTRARYKKVNIDSLVKQIQNETLPGEYLCINELSYTFYQDDGIISIRSVFVKGKSRPKEKHELNPYQYFLYRRAVFGLDVFSADDLDFMHWEKKKRITKVNARAKQLIDCYIQKILIHVTNRLFIIIFPGSHVTKDLLEFHNTPVVTDDYICTLKEYKMDKMLVTRLLIHHHVLPQNFFTMTIEDDPRMKLLRKGSNEPIDTL